MPSGVYKRTEQQNNKISLKMKGFHQSPKTEFKIGYCIPLDIRKKMSETRKKIVPTWLIDGKLSEEHKRKISEKMIGRKLSDNHKEKISIAMKRIRVGRGNPMYGINPKEHWNWQGGKSYEPYSSDWTKTLRVAIRERDKYTCIICNKYGNLVHHIDYNKKNCELNNLITLCNKCHTKTNYNRNYWRLYLVKELLKGR
jgi:hypothetical protein